MEKGGSAWLHPTTAVRQTGGHTLFRYTAKDIDGKVIRPRQWMEAADYDALYTHCSLRGLYPAASPPRRRPPPAHARPQELSDLCRQLSTLLASGVSLVRALTIISAG